MQRLKHNCYGILLQKLGGNQKIDTTHSKTVKHTTMGKKDNIVFNYLYKVYT